MANDTVTTKVSTQLPRPSAPSAIHSNLLQDVSVYKALRGLIEVTNTAVIPGPAVGSISFGTVATPATDGSPATFTQGEIDCVLIRIAASGTSAGLGVAHEWVAGGGDTMIPHGLGRMPLGYWPVKISQGVAVSNGSTAWDATNIYFKVDHSNTDCIVLIF